MRELKHPVTQGSYGLDPGTGLVRVTENGKSGLFDRFGVRVSGDQFQPDPELCNWVGGPGGDTINTKPYKTL